MIARRGEKAAKTDDKTDKTEVTEPEKPNTQLGELISKTLGFRTKPKEKPVPAPAPETPAPEKPKTIVGKRKQAPAAPDAVSIATAAATAAVKAVTAQPSPKTATPAVEGESLKDEDRHEYEVAKYLGSINPKYKGAEKVVLEHVRKAEAYAERWEKENQGKTFDPDDDEHNEFYAALEKPWSDHEFRMAENEIAAERVASRKEKGSQAKIEELTQGTARMELKPVVVQTFNNVAAELAKAVGAFEKISKSSFDKFMDEDPITAEAIARNLQPMQALVETIIEIDDPKGRIPLDQSNPNHVAWLNLLAEKEQQYAGVKDDSGKLFATRSEYHSLTPSERRGRFYLTADHLVAELVADATETVKSEVENEKKRQEKIARSMGFVKATKDTPGASDTVVTNGTSEIKDGTATPPSKPVSPSDNGSPRIDTPASEYRDASAKALAATAGILFKR